MPTPILSTAVNVSIRVVFATRYTMETNLHKTGATPPQREGG